MKSALYLFLAYPHGLIVTGTVLSGAFMNRLRRFYEKVPCGRTSSRVACVTNRASLPKALPDAEWTEDAAFSAGEAIFANPLLKEVYKEAILKGCAFEKVKI
jgi:hypothetical protein